MVYPGKNRTLCVAALVLLISFVPTAFSLDPKGLVVSGDSKDNISVILDPELIPYVHKDLEQGKTIIKIPEEASQSLKLKIDPALRAQGVVDLGKNGRELTLRINSENVYFGIQDLSELTLDDVSKSPGAVPPVKQLPPTNKDKIAERPAAEKTIPPVPRSAEKTVEKTPEKPPEKASPVQNAPAKPDVIQPTVSSLGLNMGLKPIDPGSQPANHLEGQVNPALLTPPVAQDLPENILNTTGVSITPDDGPLSDSGLNGEPAVDLDTLLKETNEAVPLEILESYREQKSLASTGMLVRIIFSLVAVLLMIVGFTKWLLPKLVERYPVLFSKREPERPFPFKTKPTPPEDKPTSGQNPLAILFGRKRKTGEPSTDPGKKAYLQRLKEDGDRFQVLTSAKLGKNKELHLVEIRGRHLVVATTPYTINLIADLDNEQAGDRTTGHALEDWADQEEVEEHLSQEQARKREIIAYLEDSKVEAPRSPSSKEHPKPYGSKPFERLASIATHQELYKKYLSPEDLNDHAQDEEMPRRQKPATPKPEPVGQAGATFVDAEEVIVLEDYDDVYRS